jgi:predicted transcriptional regulator
MAEMTGRAQPNLIRTLAKLEAVGFVLMRRVERREVPTATVRKRMSRLTRSPGTTGWKSPRRSSWNRGCTHPRRTEQT